MTDATDTPGKTKRSILVLLPLAAFLALAALFFVRLGAGDPSQLPSALIGREAPKTDLPPLAGIERDGKAVPGLSNATFAGAVLIIAASVLVSKRRSVVVGGTANETSGALSTSAP